ncbi:MULTISPECIES: ImmA/IrrE family metallo-endopeptidase [unclassified Variovorax]|uniref:ImmA/IrrE family metallo-endopeptidase n=1 Tax=unclassified Variovorax TaxID=663243 RepID=UPI0025790C74|nr:MULTISPECIES: ImmA/IrrE family metallo-endopeptidase [unclassified Variovorax]MDM0090331.1 ImmA/IrrE family metallo-endopeptidase [Variovorax sp. J22G40]MDM0148003.1 ImmA/IrrE family metallo-endopeptidase [Variovorax sp. J2P1-31]
MTSIVRNGVFRTPTGLRVKATSYAKLEAAAETLRPQLPRINGEQFALDCLTIFERTLPAAGYNYRTSDVESMGEIAGLTIPDFNVVILRQDIYDKLHENQVFGRSTVVHELSHLALQHHLTLHRGQTGTHRFCEDSEWQAKSLTAALMMPLGACLASKSSEELAHICGTSLEAAKYRISTLNDKLRSIPANHPLWRPPA